MTCEGATDLHPGHVLLVVQQFLASTKMIVIPHPPFSLGLAPICPLAPIPKGEIESQGATF
jgi:hypothetical protein